MQAQIDMWGEVQLLSQTRMVSMKESVRYLLKKGNKALHSANGEEEINQLNAQ
ncbi:hypothetical protein N9Y89_00255 [bacterium]|nr:hypothetical protein [bacterium]